MKLKSSLIMAAALSCSVLSIPTFAHEHGKHSLADSVKAAMQAEGRPDADKKRDRNRKPVQTLEFFGVKPDMKVVELIPGGGWYTRILAPILAEKGEYYGAIGTSRIERSLVGKPGFENIQITAKDASLSRPDGAKFYALQMDDLGVSDVDMVLTFRNYHNFDDAGRAKMNEAAFTALKSGGIYAVVDHTARHMEPYTNSNRRRFDPVKAIKEIQAAGFELVDYSNLHYREDDELEYEVGARSVSGNTDRFTLKFKKP